MLPQLSLSLLEHAAAVGSTKTEIRQVVQTAAPVLAKIVESLRSRRPNTKTDIELATALFVNADLRLNRTFQHLATAAHASHVVPINFKHGGRAIETINGWVSRTTRAAIPAILDPGSDTRNVDVLLANAIYFKSAWKYRFNATTQDYFHFANGQRRPITFLQTNRYFRSGFVKKGKGSGGAHWLEVPYDVSVDGSCIQVLIRLTAHLKLSYTGRRLLNGVGGACNSGPVTGTNNRTDSE